MLRLTGQRSSPPASWHSAFGPRREHWCLVEVLGLRSDQPDARTGNFLVARWKNSTMILGVDNRADRGATLIHRKELLLLQSPPTVAENKASGSRLSSRQTSRTPSTEDEKRSRAGVRKTFVDEDRRRSWAPGHLFRAASPKVEYIMQRSREPCALDRKEGRRQRRKQDQGDVRTYCEYLQRSGSGTKRETQRQGEPRGWRWSGDKWLARGTRLARNRVRNRSSRDVR
ncbi:uncharacterized protein LOC143350497 isoform X3 [Colletes latitarsis]|uniref:uncharacterized protein LOC143350497 isoform X3 n=1 Tax=Colletes latitarsis TaxID=2605962 RepID=UPI004036AA02